MKITEKLAREKLTTISTRKIILIRKENLPWYTMLSSSKKQKLALSEQCKH